MIVYVAKNKINGKVYIGQTIKNLKKRESEHWSDTKNENRHAYFHKALLKYGRDNFIWEELEQCNSPEELDNREIYWIDYYKSTDKDFGYNLSKGGQAGKGIGQQTLSDLWKTQEFKDKMKAATRKGSRKITEEDISVIKGARKDGYSCLACSEFFNIANSTAERYYYHDYPPEILAKPAANWDEKYHKIFDYDKDYKEKKVKKQKNTCEKMRQGWKFNTSRVDNIENNRRKLSDVEIAMMRLFKNLYGSYNLCFSKFFNCSRSMAQKISSGGKFPDIMPLEKNQVSKEDIQIIENLISQQDKNRRECGINSMKKLRSIMFNSLSENKIKVANNTTAVNFNSSTDVKSICQTI